MRIASVALTRNATIVTRNNQDFTSVPSLKIQDWSLEKPNYVKLSQTHEPLAPNHLLHLTSQVGSGSDQANSFNILIVK